LVQFIQQNSAIFIAGLSVIVSAVANWRVARAERETKKIKKVIRRMDILVEIERKNAIVGKLALITAQKILLIQQFPHIDDCLEGEEIRLRKNLDILKDFKNGEEEQRELTEKVNGGNDLELYGQALTDVKRLRIRMEADLEKETGGYQELLEKSRKNDT